MSDEFKITFNPDTRQGMFGDDDGGPETGLVMFDQPCGKDGHAWVGKKFFLLKGDFREDYRAITEAGGGAWACKRFYDEQKVRYGSRWSSDFHDWGKDGECRPVKETA